ncbi:MAG: cyclic nucleotide-binding domain-containing protein [Verrucomicrobia bacterium]|nr:cyclic nucleotide-binding domain-containing protein [Verrucomicrobiota bacterium]
MSGFPGVSFLTRVSTHRFEVFRHLSDEAADRVIARLPSQSFQAGEVLLRENQSNDRVYLIESGDLDIWKGEPNSAKGVKIMTLKAGSCFGEMSAINGAATTATVVAAAPAVVRSLRLDELPEGGPEQKQVTLNLARMLVERLTSATTSIKAKHEAEMAALKVVASASSFLTRILTALSFYMFAMPLILFIKPLLPSDSLISFFFIVAFLWVVLDFMKQTQIPQEHFHMTMKGWLRQVLTGVLWALPFMVGFLVVKFWLAHAHPETIKVFEPMRALASRPNPNYLLWTGFALTYAGLSFAQEFIRCAVQGTLDMIEVKPTIKTHWKSILVSDVVFASIHMHLGSMFALLAFIAGFVFGFMFWRARSYLAVATAHALFGVWAIFVIGVPR